MSHKAVLYTKEGCTLCSQARAILDRLKDEFDLEVVEVDIAADSHLYEIYQNIIPVVAIEGRAALIAPISEFRLRRALGD